MWAPGHANILENEQADEQQLKLLNFQNTLE